MTKLFLYLFFLFAPFLSAAQAQKEKVEQAVEKLRLAMVSGKKSDLEAIASDRLSYGHSLGKVENKTQFVEAISSGRSDFVNITLSDQTVDVAGPTAIVRHVLSAETNDNNKPGKVKLAILLVFQQEKGQWKMLARQAVRQPAE